MRLESTNPARPSELNFRLHSLVQDGERARIGVDQHIERPIPPVVKT